MNLLEELKKILTKEQYEQLIGDNIDISNLNLKYKITLNKIDHEKNTQEKIVIGE